MNQLAEAHRLRDLAALVRDMTDKGSVVAAFMRRRILDGAPLVVYGDGSQTRDYFFVEDLCEGIVAALTSGGSGTFQLGSGVGTSAAP